MQMEHVYYIDTTMDHHLQGSRTAGKCVVSSPLALRLAEGSPPISMAKLLKTSTAIDAIDLLPDIAQLFLQLFYHDHHKTL